MNAPLEPHAAGSAAAEPTSPQPLAAPGEARRSPLSWPILLWGILGVLALLGQAVARLSQVALDAVLHHPFGAGHWALLVGWTAFMVHSEGYRGFQRGFSPRVVARALHLAAHPRPWLVVLAPVYCMSLVYAARRRLVASWIVLAGIVTLVLLVRQLPQPYRGIIDVGVVAGLLWGIVFIGYFLVRGLRGHGLPVPADLPDEHRDARP